MGKLLESINPLERTAGTSIKSRTVHDDVQRTLQELAAMPSSIDLSDAVKSDAETEKKLSFTLKPKLHSLTVQSGDDVETEVQRLVGGEVSVTFKF